MKQEFRLYQRGSNGRYYIEDNATGKQESLGTSDKAEALRLVMTRNESAHQEALGHASAAIHRAYAKSVRVELPPLEEYEQRRAEPIAA